MRLCYLLNGRFTSIYFSMNSAVTSGQILQLLKTHEAHFVREGYVHNLFLDFEGEHIIVHKEEELDIICRLLEAYQNNCIRQRLQVYSDHFNCLSLST